MARFPLCMEPRTCSAWESRGMRSRTNRERAIERVVTAAPKQSRPLSVVTAVSAGTRLISRSSRWLGFCSFIATRRSVPPARRPTLPSKRPISASASFRLAGWQ
ncbi:MAG: hypothetical protein HYY83_06615 [Deltaproteobacteria bacterium]|nr:hypothetical protein [Deltaproteobacteria bacterium]